MSYVLNTSTLLTLGNERLADKEAPFDSEAELMVKAFRDVLKLPPPTQLRLESAPDSNDVTVVTTPHVYFTKNQTVFKATIKVDIDKLADEAYIESKEKAVFDATLNMLTKYVRV